MGVGVGKMLRYGFGLPSSANGMASSSHEGPIPSAKSDPHPRRQKHAMVEAFWIYPLASGENARRLATLS